MVALELLARDLGISRRTLRRAFADGALRGARPSPRRFVLSPGEESYLLRAWPLISSLREALRTERNVRLAVLYGSRARGDHHEGSDVDILVDLVDGSTSRQLALADRLEKAVGKPVQLLEIGAARRAPLLLAAALDDGRVLIDRAEAWAALQAERSAIAADAAIADADLRARAQAAIAELLTT